MVDVHGKSVGKYTILTMDPMGFIKPNKVLRKHIQ